MTGEKNGARGNSGTVQSPKSNILQGITIGFDSVMWSGTDFNTEGYVAIMIIDDGTNITVKDDNGTSNTLSDLRGGMIFVLENDITKIDSTQPIYIS